MLKKSFIRLNNLIISINNLSLSILTDDITRFQYYSSYIYSLTIVPKIDINLKNFHNIRRLTLLNLNYQMLEQFENRNILPYLEHLFIIYRMNQSSILHLHTKIFSSAFPNLISCTLLGFGVIHTAEDWTQSPSIRILKFRFINLLVYKSILSVCPNLYFLRMSMPNVNMTPIDIKPHMNLKRLILKIPYNISSQIDNFINDLLASTTNLEELDFYRFISMNDFLTYFRDYHWLAMVINLRLGFLRRFRFHIDCSSYERSTELDLKSIWKEIEEQSKKSC